MRTVRTFLAAPLPEEVCRAVGRLQQTWRDALPEVRWVRPANLHLTLRFFGGIPQETLETIKTSVLSVERRQKPFQIRVQGVGVFPDPRRPRVLWLGLSPQEDLQALYRTCEAALAEAGIAPETRAFRPHLTIGRFRQRSPALRHILADQDDRLVASMTVDRLVLYESRLLPHGAEHDPLLVINLAGG